MTKDRVQVKKNILAVKRVQDWHGDVVYGGGLVMTEQLIGTVNKIKKFYKGSNEDNILLAAHLYKAIDRKRLNEDTTEIIKQAGLYDENADFLTRAFESDADLHSRNTYAAIAEDFSPEVADIVKEICSEPQEKEGQSKTEQWEEKAAWAKELSKEAQVILLAEKLQNFEVSRSKPNPKWPPQKHIDYYNTRMIMVNTLKSASPELYQECVNVAQAGIAVQQMKAAALERARAGKGM